MSSADVWMKKWPEALELWGKYIKLRDPLLTRRKKVPGKKTATPLAYIDLQSKQVVVSLDQVEKLGLEPYALEILAHEVGHHVFAPGDLLDAARCMARIRKALREYEGEAGLILNLYTDLLINHRLKAAGLAMEAIYARLRAAPGESVVAGQGTEPGKHAGQNESADPLWNLYMRIYELLWSLSPRTLCESPGPEMDGDAMVAAQVIRSFGSDVVRGSGMFAAICYYYIKESGTASARKIMQPLLDADEAGADGIPDGLVDMDEGEEDECSYPEFDEHGNWIPPQEPDPESAGSARGQSRMPLDYYNTLKALGINVSQEEATIKYYREKSRPYLIPFPTTESEESSEPLLEGYEIWQPGQMIERINWFQSLLRSPIVIPGYTTVQNRYGTTEGQSTDRSPMDLDLYVDCSGSMPRPSISISYPALAGAIVALSALRSGSSVQATLWSGPNQWQITEGFVRDETAILAVLTGYIGGGTAFPLHILRKTYLEGKPRSRKTHILVISDDGVDTILQNDEKGQPGADIAARALEAAGGGGTFALQLYSDWEKNGPLVQCNKLGFQIHQVGSAQDLTQFARDFARKNYYAGKGKP